jgi:uncharacterized coiled-coil DUF342 family protein
MTAITIDHITHYTNELITVRNQIAFFTQKLDELKEKRDMTQRTLIDAMKSSNLKSWKTNDNSFSLVSKMDTLEGLVSERIDTIRFKQIANLLLKQTGELFFGTETVTSEYLSIRSLTKDTESVHGNT